MSQQNARFTELMNACRASQKYRMVSVIVNGCGDAFITRYWPYLQQLVLQGAIKLTVVDLFPLSRLIEEKLKLAEQSGEKQNVGQLTSNYAGLVRLLEERPSSIQYLNRSDQADLARYFHLTADIVFVLVPDCDHIECAKEWLRRAVLVLIEKPYNRDLVMAQVFEETLKEIVRTHGEDHPYTLVVCIDHWLAKIHLFVAAKDSQALQEDLGVIERIEFSICEAGGVEPWRASSLQGGMVYDLFCHALAMVSPFVRLSSFLEVKNPNILVAQHRDCPIENESYARFRDLPLQDFRGREVMFGGVLGKGVGQGTDQQDAQEDVKYLKLYGKNGSSASADFGPQSQGKVLLGRDDKKYPYYDIGQGHLEMLRAIFEGHFLENPIGKLHGQTPLETLQIITSIRGSIRDVSNLLKQPERRYPVGASPEEIDKLAVSL